MNQKITRGFLMVLGVICLCLTIPKELESKALHANPLERQGEKKALIELIRKWEAKYNVLFTYDRRIVEFVEVEVPDTEMGEIGKALDYALEKTELKYTILENRYVILYRNDREGIKSLKKMVEHLSKIIKSENKKFAGRNVKTIDRLNTHNALDLYLKRMVINITGIVTNESGEPLIGVNVLVKGTNKGTSTDFEGRFDLEDIDEKAVLVLSYVGFQTQEVLVAGKSSLSITLVSDSQLLDEVVVVGYGTKKKSHLTAAVSQIDGKLLNDRPLRSVGDALHGMVAGLNVRTPSGAPESTPNLNIRGFTGFNTAAQPLILVDGVERELYDVNPNDIETISVLKDGAATAIYGSRAPNGIILITTKSGKRNEKMQINYLANLRFGRPYGLAEQLDNYEWAGFVNEAFRNQPGGGKAPFFSELQVERMKAFAEGDFNNSVFDGIDPEYVPYGTFPISPTNWGGHTETFSNVNWLELALEDVVPSSQHNVSVSGGSVNTSYYMSLGYNENTGMFKGTNFKNRYSALMKVESDITNWLNVNLSTNYVKTDEEGPNFRGGGRDYGTIFNNFARAFPIWVTTNPNGSYARFNSLPQFIGEGGTEKQNLNRILLSGGVTLNPLNGLTVKGMYTWKNWSQDFDRNTLQLFQVLPNGQRVTTQRSEGRTSILKRYANNNYHTIDIHMAYSRTFGDLHHLSARIGYQEENNVFNQIIGEATGFFSPSVLTLSTSSDNFMTSDQVQDWSTRGFFGRLSYNFDEKYFVEFNGRRDATSRFLAENRWGFFPSVSVGWNAAKENFWVLKDLISEFKPRASWSTSGDANVGLYPFYPSINISVSNDIILNGNLVSTASLPPLVNNRLTWAKPTTIDFGFDLSAFQGRMEVNYDWYQRTIRDQFGPPPSLPKTLGANVPDANNAISETRGWEVNLSWRDEAFDLFNKPLNYNIGLRYSDYIGYVVEYQDDGTGAVSGQWTPGEIFGQNYYYVSNGVMQNREDLYANPSQGGSWYYPGDLAIKDLNGDGEINSGITGTWYNRGDVVKKGFNYPRGTYGITLGAEWNNFDISLLLDGVLRWTKYAGHMYVWGTSGSQWYAPFYKEHAELGYWAPNNTGAFYPRNSLSGKNRNRANNQYALDLSHLRIRNLRLGYNLAKLLTDRFGISRLYLPQIRKSTNLGKKPV